MRYAIIGARGQLGQALRTRLQGKVVELNRPDFDLTQPLVVDQTLTAFKPTVVLNCAAYNLVDRAESAPVDAFATNAVGIAELARICRKLNCILVHFSTDYVFGQDAERRQPYNEIDTPGPLNVYGISKLAGEYAVRLLPRHFVIRTCGLYGHGEGGKGGNFVKTMLRLATKGGPIRVVNDQWCTPTNTVDLADAVCKLLATEHWGLYHITNSEACTWYEFAAAIFARAGKQVDLRPVTSAEFTAVAARPRYSVLANLAWQELGQAPLRPWQEAVAEYLQAVDDD